MLKKLADSVFSFDVEWIPDPKSAEILHDLPPAPGREDNSFEALWASARKRGCSRFTTVFKKPYYVELFRLPVSFVSRHRRENH